MDSLSPEEKRELLKSIYGSWNFYDGEAESRPIEPYATVEDGGVYLDVPGGEFPMSSWQVDAVYVNHFLDAAEKLVRRGQEGIYSTFAGYGIDVTMGEGGRIKGEIVNEGERSRRRHDMFRLAEVDLGSVTTVRELNTVAEGWQSRGGWTTPRSMDGLERRLLHAMMTNGNFTVVVTGSWQAMGYGGNHGWQSVAGRLEYLLSGLFEKLGVKLVVRGIGLPPKTQSVANAEEEGELLSGARSTLENALGWSSIYGSDVDMVVWDDYSILKDEKGQPIQDDDYSAELFDFFARQALLSGDGHLPFLWGGDFEVLRNLHEFADVDVGQLGNGMSGVPETTGETMALTLPWASQYLNCSPKMKEVCERNENKFVSQCWDDSSKLDPLQPQLSNIPVLPTAIGWRKHQLKAYTLGYNLLAALLDALDLWSEKTIYEGHPLADEYWHMEDYIKNVQSKIQSLKEEDAPHCHWIHESMKLPKRLCQQRLKGRTEHTPRANPADTRLRSIVVPSASGGLPNYDLESVFDEARWENPIAELPSHAVDTLEIFELGKDTRRQLSADLHRRQASESGNRWHIVDSFPHNDCNGSYTLQSSCGRVSSSTCLMEGHHGSRGYIAGDEASGKLTMTVPGVEFGFVALNLRVGNLADPGINIAETIPDTFRFEYAVDGATTTLDKTSFLEKLQVFEGIGLLTVMEHEKMTSSQDVEIYFSVSGCSREEKCQIAISHLYWL